MHQTTCDCSPRWLERIFGTLCTMLTSRTGRRLWPPSAPLRIKPNSLISAKPLETDWRRRLPRTLRHTVKMPLSATWLVPSWRRSWSTGLKSFKRMRMRASNSRKRTTAFRCMHVLFRTSSRRSLCSARSPSSRIPSNSWMQTGNSNHCTPSTSSMRTLHPRMVNWRLLRSILTFCHRSTRQQRWLGTVSSSPQGRLEHSRLLLKDKPSLLWLSAANAWFRMELTQHHLSLPMQHNKLDLHTLP
jgi:hypothetical protein